MRPLDDKRRWLKDHRNSLQPLQSGRTLGNDLSKVRYSAMSARIML
jgi:hypothetical protein